MDPVSKSHATFILHTSLKYHVLIGQTQEVLMLLWYPLPHKNTRNIRGLREGNERWAETLETFKDFKITKHAHVHKHYISLLFNYLHIYYICIPYIYINVWGYYICKYIPAILYTYALYIYLYITVYKYICLYIHI